MPAPPAAVNGTVLQGPPHTAREVWMFRNRRTDQRGLSSFFEESRRKQCQYPFNDHPIEYVSCNRLLSMFQYGLK